MFHNTRAFERLHWGGAMRTAGLAVLVAGMAYLPAAAQQAGQKTFSTAEEAAKSLVAAVQAHDESALLGILGPDAKTIVSSGDSVEDKNNQDEFAQKYQQMHRLVTEPDGKTTLYIGAENYPTPIPLVRRNGKWYFDTSAGKQEILYRRIGKNELAVIQVCHELVDAQKEYYNQPHDGNSGHEYAQKFFSDSGQHNGLYWESSSGQPESPIGPLIAKASASGYNGGTAEQPEPFYGYYFRILPAKDGGTGGFAFVAYPAEYRSTGVMTFMVNENGTVYEKDLGAHTEDVARNLKGYERSGNWHKADQNEQASAHSETSR